MSFHIFGADGVEIETAPFVLAIVANAAMIGDKLLEIGGRNLTRRWEWPLGRLLGRVHACQPAYSHRNHQHQGARPFKNGLCILTAKGTRFPDATKSCGNQRAAHASILLENNCWWLVFLNF